MTLHVHNYSTAKSRMTSFLCQTLVEQDVRPRPRSYKCHVNADTRSSREQKFHQRMATVASATARSSRA
jgi:hypothetical protein